MRNRLESSNMFAIWLQIREIEAQMAEEPSDALEEARRDLVELVALLKEEQVCHVASGRLISIEN